MKPQIPTNNDSKLGKLLHEWKVESSLPPRFNEQVWLRIEKAEAPGNTLWTLLQNWIARTFVRPAMAVSYVTVLLLAGLTIGFWQGRANSERAAAELSARYVQAMNAYDSHR